MQFVPRGPDIPDTLLQAHEEGRVVFFCGSGISRPAGLPGFKGLVDEIYSIVGTHRNEVEQEAYEHSRYDATLNLLERRLPGQRIEVRNALATVLKPNFSLEGATDTHLALLQLSRDRKDALRLVTTNFDRIFEQVALNTAHSINTYSAPMLPIPKNSRWNGLVYLHGLLPAKSDESALQKLVVTSGDFGLAYLTERWASRFVSELFRSYVVCFVGYGINDPVMRYMMDALAADRMQGEVAPQAYALGDFDTNQEQRKYNEWKSKGVMPILYEVPSNSNDHSLLHRTLKVWAETYRDGITGKERIVVEYAIAHPSASSQQDDFVGRMLWALSDVSGLPAKRFAEFNPAPALAWLDVLFENRFQYRDLSRFGIPPLPEVDDKLKFSLLYRPAPYTHAPWMSLVSRERVPREWDNILPYLAHWFVRHLNDPALILWMTKRGGRVHYRLRWAIESELERISKLEREGNTVELEEIRTNSPNAIPRPDIKLLWRLLLAGRVKSNQNEPDFSRWEARVNTEGLTTTLRLELREILAPMIILKKPFRWESDDEDVIDGEIIRLRRFIDWELALAADHVHSSIQDLKKENWNEIFPTLLEEFQQLLRDALDILYELGEANTKSDRSFWDLPSISDHWQNRGFRDWVALIELLRDSWLATWAKSPERAALVARTWFNLPFPTFKRLALFAASQPDCIESEQWVDWLISSDSWWLWSTDTKRETIRLLVLRGATLSLPTKLKLETAILKGPPREMYREDIDVESWKSLVEHSVWLLLAKLQKGGCVLGNEALQQYEIISITNPEWKLAENESDEFSHWMSGTGDPDYERTRDIDIAPRKRNEIVNWLRKPPPVGRPFYEDTWREVCSTRFFHCVCALGDLAQQGYWPTERWKDALQTWSEEGKALRAWKFAAPLVQKIPDTNLIEIAHSITWWLRAVCIAISIHEDIFNELCRRILSLAHQEDFEIDQPVSKAINHPIGRITQALLDRWLARNPSDNDGLPKDIEPFFTQLCDSKIVKFRHARVVLASRLITLYRIDTTWTEKYLLPLFSWSTDPIEARSAWIGFLWAPRLYPRLLNALKVSFLETANHFSTLGENKQQFAPFLVHVALSQPDGYSALDFRAAIGALPQEGLQYAAQALWQILDGAGEQRESYWENRIKPFWKDIWPKSRDLASKSIAESLARLCVSARGKFPEALAHTKGWLQPIEHPYYIVHILHETDLCRKFPSDALQLLSAIIVEQPWASRELDPCLSAISDAQPELAQDYRYQKLLAFVRRSRV